MFAKLNSLTGRLMAAAACIAATQLGVWVIHWDGRSAAAQTKVVDVTALPLEIDNWFGTPTELDPRVFQKIGAASLVNRKYRNASGREVSVHIAAYSAREMVLAHHPHECYPGEGWSILKDDWHTDRLDCRYRLMIVERSGGRAAVAYWYQLGAESAAEQDDLRKILQRLRWQGKGWPNIVKVLIQIPLEFDQDDGTTVADDLVPSIYEWIKDNS